MGKLLCAFSFPLFLRVPVSIVCCCLFPFFSPAQTSERDSLLKLLQILPEDTNKVNVLNRLCYMSAKSDSKNALIYGQNALNISNVYKFKKGELMAYAHMGRVYRISGDFNKAISLQGKALKIGESLKDFTNIAESLRELGSTYRSKGDFPQALKYFFESLRIYGSEGDKKSQANTMASIGMLYYKQSRYQESIKFHNSALKIHKSFGQENNVAIDYNNLANVYSSLRDYKKALYYFENYKNIKTKLGDRRGIAIALSNMSGVYIKQKKYEIAIRFCKQSIQIREDLGLKTSKMYPLYNLAKAYLAINDFDKAIKCGVEALNISKDAGAKLSYSERALLLSQIYQKAGLFENALKYHQEYKIYADSIFNEKKSKQIAEMETKYGTEKKEQENKYLKLQDVKNKALIRQSTLLNIAAVIGVVLLVALAVVLYRSNLRKQRTNKVLLSQKQEIEIQTEKLRKTNNELEKANVLTRKDRDQKVKIYLQEATEATSKLQQIQDMFTQKGADVAQKLLTNEINTAGELSIIQEKVRNEFPDFAQEIDKALADAKITKVIWQVGYCLKLGKAPVDIAKILPISNRTVSVYGSKLRKMGVLAAIKK